jgi:hypothetical protein
MLDILRGKSLEQRLHVKYICESEIWFHMIQLFAKDL